MHRVGFECKMICKLDLGHTLRFQRSHFSWFKWLRNLTEQARCNTLVFKSKHTSKNNNKSPERERESMFPMWVMNKAQLKKKNDKSVFSMRSEGVLQLSQPISDVQIVVMYKYKINLGYFCFQPMKIISCSWDICLFHCK